ncbi:MAG: hypothetical protein RLO52_31735 [Sandaracinaceae bacterium]
MRRFVHWLAAAIAFFGAARGVAAWHGRDADALFDGELEAQRERARAMDAWTEADLDRGDFATGSARFDGEWLFATRMMAVLGYAQTALANPALRDENLARMDDCLDRLTHPDARRFDREAWGHDALADLGTTRDHVGYLGYLSLALAVTRAVNPETRHAALEARVMRHLVERAAASETGLLETYPGEVYPIDNTSFFGALGLHDRITGEDHTLLRARLSRTLEVRYRDPRTGLLYQRVDPDDGAPLDGPRGSGTALAAYFLSFGDAPLSRSLYGSIRGHLVRSTLGFGTTREHPAGTGGWGDVDSGPVLLGQGVSVTGFTLALARMYGDRETFRAHWATASFFGGPVDGHHAMGGPIGDALLFALTSALPPRYWENT